MSIDTATGKEAPAELSTDRVRHIFSTIARQYERFNLLSSLGTYRRWLATFVARIPASHESRVLDVAGGTGDVTFSLARAKHPEFIVCSDLVPEMLEVAEEHYAQGGADTVPVDFIVADAQNMPFRDGCFDVVTMAYGIRNMPDREQALSEIFRVLKPGGSFTCLEFSTPENPLWRALYGTYLHHIMPLWGALLTGEKADFVYLADSIHSFPNQATFANLLEEAGFANVSWENLTGGIAAIHTAEKPSSSPSLHDFPDTL